jgi:hypothetical protein
MTKLIDECFEYVTGTKVREISMNCLEKRKHGGQI